MDQVDHATRALRTARTIRGGLLALNARQTGVDEAIGVSSGCAVAGNVGAEQRDEYTVIGDPVNEAARLTDEAKHRLGRILASEEAVEGPMNFRPGGDPVYVPNSYGGPQADPAHYSDSVYQLTLSNGG